jgi:hypothetical protein
VMGAMLVSDFMVALAVAEAAGARHPADGLR